MRKSFISILCIFLAAIFSLVGCGKKNEEPYVEPEKKEEETIDNEVDTHKYIDDDSEVTYDEEVIERFYPDDENNGTMESQNNGYGNVSSSTDFYSSKTVSGTIHNFEITDTNEYLFQNGSSRYKILISKTASEYERIAAE